MADEGAVRAVVAVTGAQEFALDVVQHLTDLRITPLCVVQNPSSESKEDTRKLLEYCVGKNLQVLCNASGRVLEAAIREFQPAFCVSVPASAAPIAGELKGLPSLSIRLGEQAGLGGLGWAIWQGQPQLSVSCAFDHKHETLAYCKSAVISYVSICPNEVSWVAQSERDGQSWFAHTQSLDLEPCDNAYTLYWKCRSLAEGSFVLALRDTLSKFGVELDTLPSSSTSAAANKEQQVVPPFENEDLPEHCLPEWDADQADRFIRAKTFPPR